jgi:hypothetical protein
MRKKYQELQEYTQRVLLTSSTVCYLLPVCIMQLLFHTIMLSDNEKSFVLFDILLNTDMFLLGAGVAHSTDWTTGVLFPTEAEDFSSSPCVQTGFGAHPASCPVGTGGPLLGGKARPGRDADHSPPSSAVVKYE